MASSSLTLNAFLVISTSVATTDLFSSSVTSNMAHCLPEETKEDKIEFPPAPKRNNLVGHWKCPACINGTNYYGTQDIELVGTSCQGKAHTAYSIRSKYVGVVNGDQVTLTYQDAGSQYTASVILKITAYAMDGTWNDSSRNLEQCSGSKY